MRTISPAQALEMTARGVGAPAQNLAAVIRAAVRRASFVLAPTTTADLIAFVRQPLEGLIDDPQAQVEAALDGLTTYGEILEIRPSDADRWTSPAHVLRPAPPSFVARTGQPFVILGVAGDHPSALTTELEARLDDSGPVRRLTPALGEDLEDRLKSLGLIALPEATWFGEPKARPASDHLAEWSRRLAQASDPGPGLVGLEVLNGRRSPTYYSGRWGPPDGLPDGLHVARRQQRFGASIWCLVDLLAGYPVRLLDLQAEGDRQRPCDLAWRLQAAIDAQAAQPQSYRLVPSGPHTALHLFSPLPAFAERRLALAGDKMHPPGCLFAFDLPRGVVDQEISKLGSMLWMSPRPDGQSA